MTEQEIKGAARSASKGIFVSTNAAADYETGFEEGAKWALSQTQWVSVENWLPEENVPVLWCRHPVEEPYLVASMWDEEFTEYGDNYFTHWMPLPQPPQKGGGDERD